jgi:hypothetical protein
MSLAGGSSACLAFRRGQNPQARHSIICFMNGAVRTNQTNYAVRLLSSITVIEYNEI